MSVKIRLTRTGRNKICTYRLVVQDSKSKRDGRFVEVLGTYNPQTNPKQFQLKTGRIAYWLKQGAQPSETVSNLLKQDRFAEKAEALGKGLDLSTVAVVRKPERKRKPKTRKAKAE